MTSNKNKQFSTNYKPTIPTFHQPQFFSTNFSILTHPFPNPFFADFLTRYRVFLQKKQVEEDYFGATGAAVPGIWTMGFDGFVFCWAGNTLSLGIQAPNLRMVMEPKYYAEEVIGHAENMTGCLGPLKLT